MAAAATTTTSTTSTTSTTTRRHQRQHHHLRQQQEPQQPRQQQQQSQQQQQQQQHRRQMNPLHLQLHKVGAVAAAVAVFGLLFTIICVNGQIDGYTAGVDYPTYESVPKGLSFKCQGRLPGYYADPETRCQVWHWCLHSGHQYSFLCPNGTVFNQAVRVCDWWSHVNCPVSEQLYENNEELYRPTEQNGQADI